MRSTMIARVVSVALSALLFLAWTPRADAETTHEWLVVSDIHFDPFADARIVDRLAATPGERWRSVFASDAPQPMSGYGADTNYSLLESALDAMRNAQSEPPAIILTGDFLAHHFREKFNKALPGRDDAAYAAFVDSTIAFLASEFRAAYPHAQFVPAIGNNDSYCGDYQSTPNSPFFAKFAAAWGLQANTNGYYTAALPAKNATAVVLNDVFMSAQYTNACGDKNANAGDDELSWLSATLNSLKGQKAWLIMHIPPGVDTFSTLRVPAGSPTVMFLAPKYNDTLIAALSGTQANIVAAFGAHLHMNSYRLIGSEPSRPTIGMLLNPAVSPVFASNPTFTVIRVGDDQGNVQDARYYTIEDITGLSKDARRSGVWHLEYDFAKVYGPGAIDATHLANLQHDIFSDDRLRKSFDAFYDGGSGRAPITDATWRAYWCSNVALTATAFVACASPEVQPVKRP